DPEDGLLALLRELNIGFVPYSPLGRGFLTGQFQTPEDIPEGDVRRMMPRFQGENFQANIEMVRLISALASRKSVTPAQLALAWVLAQGDDIVPIPGTRSPRRVEENLAALDIDLAEAELAEIDRIMPRGAAAGTRYAAPMMASLGR